jgi:TATA-binding protein-associated factor Taf7
MFEQGNKADIRMDAIAEFTSTLKDEHSQYGSNLNIMIKQRYASMMNRMQGYLKNDEASLNFFNANPDLKQLMGEIR